MNMEYKKKQKVPGSGRTKGTPNKRTMKFAEALESTGFDVAVEAVKLFQETDDVHLKHKILTLLATYTVAVPKPKEESNEENNNEQISEEIQDLAQKSSEELIKLIK